MDGRTSDVIQRLNLRAPGSLLPITREYMPDSLITCKSCFPPRVSHFATPLSSSSTCLEIASRPLLYPRASAISLPTIQGSPEISTTRTLPNSCDSNVFIKFSISFPPLVISSGCHGNYLELLLLPYRH